MLKTLFVCHGNICRSPMAEYIMKYLAKKAGIMEELLIDSAAVSREEIGSDVYPPAKRKLSEHGIPFVKRKARQIEESDLKRYNMILVMGRSNLRRLSHMFGVKQTENIVLLMSVAGENRDVEDPWYTGDFEEAYRDILAGCEALLQTLINDGLKRDYCG